MPISKNKLRDFTGQTFGQVTVLNELPRQNTHRMWRCQCVCGRIWAVRDHSLCRQRHIKSCGCLKNQYISEANRTHGQSHTAVYGIWIDMRKRCQNPKHKFFHHYGGRGIKVCERWNKSFEAFLKDMGERPSRKYSIERVDNDGDYCPENCIWALKIPQANNTRRNHKLTFNGQTLTLAEWGRIITISADAIKQRLRLGWSTEDALTAPLFTKRKSLQKPPSLK